MSAAPPPRQATVEERKKQIAQLAEMGIAVPDEFRRDLALAGEWQTVSERVITPKKDEEQEDNKPAESSALNIGVRKRKHEGDDEEDAEEEAKMLDAKQPRKAWGSGSRGYPGAAGDDDDLDALLAKTSNLKRKEKDPAGAGTALDSEVKAEEKDAATTEPSTTDTPAADPAAAVKKEEPEEEKLSDDAAPAEAVPAVVFKKRKNKAAKK